MDPPGPGSATPPAPAVGLVQGDVVTQLGVHFGPPLMSWIETMPWWPAASTQYIRQVAWMARILIMPMA
jgi:hypothetical protein